MNWVRMLPPWLAVTLLSMLPVIELKGSIPVGVAMGMDPWAAFWLAWLTCTIPVPFILLFLRPVFRWMKTKRLFRGIAEFFERHAEKKASAVRKYELLGLFILVAIPLPGTGVWTGSLVAAVMDLRISHALPVILIGNLVAALCMTFVTGAITLL